MWSLGSCLEQGLGVAQDARKAVEWYIKCADLGNPDAMCHLGYCFRSGTGVEPDDRRAVEWFQKSADLGNHYAMRQLTIRLRNGRGVAPDEKKTTDPVPAPSDQSRRSTDTDTEAHCMYGRGFCLEDDEGFRGEKDATKALEWYQKSADLGYPPAMYRLRASLEKGIGDEKDATRALECFQRFADLGNSHAMFCLGICLEKGIGVAKDEEKALVWFRKSDMLDGFRKLASHFSKKQDHVRVAINYWRAYTHNIWAVQQPDYREYMNAVKNVSNSEVYYHTIPLRAEIAQLRAENKTVWAENDKVTAENKAWKTGQCAHVQRQSRSTAESRVNLEPLQLAIHMEVEIDQLRTENETLRAENEKMRTENEKMRAETRSGSSARD